MDEDRMPWICRNPFFILELSPTATRGEIERKAQKLLNMLEMEFTEVAVYSTPLGQFPRTSQDIRESLAALRDPKQRILYEFWAQHGGITCISSQSENQSKVRDVLEENPCWNQAFQALGWRCL